MTNPEDRARLDQNRSRLFTSDLSVAEFALLHGLGYTPLGLVMGTCVHRVGFQGAPWTESVELTTVTQAMYSARHLAMSRMVAEAKYLGADGIVGMRLDIGGKHLGLDNTALEFIAIGTAVRLPAGEVHPATGSPSTEPFTSDLSGQDLYTLHQAGFRPVSLVIGSCVYHVAASGMSQPAYLRGTENSEMVNYTRAIYHARELAMDRMQAEAVRDGAVGIIGVKVTEHARNWDKQVLEFLAVGTSIRAVNGAADRKGVQFTLSLDG